MHVVIRSSQARGQKSFLAFDTAISKILTKQADRFGVRLYQTANAGNHIHMIVKVQSRDCLSRFLKSISGLIARKVEGKERGKARLDTIDASLGKVSVKRDLNNLKAINKTSFFDARPYTRVVTWGRDFNGLKKYLVKNSLEMIGMVRANSTQMLKDIDKFLKQSNLVSIGFG